MPNQKGAWLIRHVDIEGPGSWTVFLNKGVALKTAADSAMEYLAQAESELSDPDEEVVETIAEIRQDFSERKYEDVVESWLRFAADQDLARWTGTFEFEQGLLHTDPKDWAPEKMRS